MTARLLALGALLLVSGCNNEWGLLLEVKVADDVPDQLERLRVRIENTEVSEEQIFSLEGKPLPQTIAVVSKGITGDTRVTVEGVVGNRIRANGRVNATLEEGKRNKVEVVLQRYCPASTCCIPKTCAEDSCGTIDDGCGGTVQCGGCPGGDCVNNVCSCVVKKCEEKSCGTFPDGCGSTVSCGECSGGEVCGGGGANLCGAGSCSPETSCAAGLNCGFVSDGCSDVLSCGACPAGTACGSGPDGGVPNVCGCAPVTLCGTAVCGKIADGCGGQFTCADCPGGQRCLVDAGTETGSCCAPRPCVANACGPNPDGCGGTVMCAGCTGGKVCLNDGGMGNCCQPAAACPPQANCGLYPDGCGGLINCGMCTGGLTCGAGNPGTPNVCGCTPDCTNKFCGAADGCGGVCQTGECGAGQACSNGHCCSTSQAWCGGQCIDVSANQTNCGACGKTCPSGSTCQQGACSCETPAQNADGHCCPPGWTFARDHGTQRYNCYLGPLDAGTHDQASARCKQATAGLWSGGITAVGAGRSTLTRLSLPEGAVCSSLWQSGLAPTAITNANAAASELAATCSAGCTDNSTCICRSCALCTSSSALGCVQPYYCAVEPLGPQQLSCSGGDDSMCPPGSYCLAVAGTGSCFSLSGKRPCVLDADCPPRAGSTVICASRQGPSLTGTCEYF